MKTGLTLLIGTVALAVLPTFAANIVVTGHDDDYHQSPGALIQIQAFSTFAANGSSLPFLVFDAGSELTSSLAAAGVTNFVNVNPLVAGNITNAIFDATKYSAFMVASDVSCFGCDNNATTSANINAHSAAIASFINAGGGVVAFAGADNTSYYGFLPQTAASPGGAPNYGYFQTSAGAALGIPAVDGDATHNLFSDPGTGGTPSAYQVAEISVYGNGTILGPKAATTLVCQGCSIQGGVIISTSPEPSSIALLTSGLGVIASFLLTKRKSFSARTIRT